MARSRKKKAELLPQPAADAPLDSAALLAHAQPVLDMLTDDLLKRADASPAITRALKASHASEKSSDRTGESYAVWRRQTVVQIAAAWLLSCVFVRTLEDRGLLTSNRIAGEGALGSQHSFFQIAPYLTERDYLRAIFRELEHYPATEALFDRKHNLAWRLAPSADAAKQLLELFRTPSADAPAFRFGQVNTRFLGDLYQDLSEDVRQRYALLQTPDFVEAFILDRTLEPALEEFGLADTDIIDPTCGSGHFLLGAFDRLYERWVARGESPEQAVENALEKVCGVDINPYAVSIARFRLTLAALDKLGTMSLDGAPRLTLNVARADSLIDGELSQLPGTEAAAWDPFSFTDEEAKPILRRSYAAVVGNPPYITVKDNALRERYRKAYASAAGKYALAAPFMERFFKLARRGSGFTGQITANSFMKREFGKSLIENVLPGFDLELIVNTAGAYIPGHGTPTVLVFGRNRSPEGAQVHAVLARRGEPSTPEDPAEGLVWSSIREHWDEDGFENEYITVEKVEREKLKVHPWSLEGGGAGELKALLEERAEVRLGDVVESIGFMAITGEDEVFVADPATFDRHRLPARAFGIGESVRDWSFHVGDYVLFPYDDEWSPRESDVVVRWLWPFRSNLRTRLMFGKTQIEAGLDWWAYRHFGREKVKTPLSIAFAEVATHNHFVLDRGGKVFKQTAPIIKLPETATEDDHLALLAYLNSSVACFWMKQVSYPKGMHNGSEANATPFLVRFAFDGTKLSRLPVPEAVLGRHRSRFVELGRKADQLARALADSLPADGSDLNSDSVSVLAERRELLRKQLVSTQEKIDWLTYAAFDLADEQHIPNVPEGIGIGCRPFEIELIEGRGTASDGSWFRWLEIDPGAVRPSDDERTLHSQWKRWLASDRCGGWVALLESGTYKRRWRQPLGKAAQHVETDHSILHRHAATMAMSVLEAEAKAHAAPVAGSVLAGALEVAEIFSTVSATFNATETPSGELAAHSVPFSSAYMFTDPGLEKLAAWEHTWNLQRQEDAGKKVGQIPVPPKFDQKDFRDPTYWRLRGKLNVPKERFIAYPGCESDRDSEPVYGWAGWDHAQRAKALAGLYVDRKDNEGWSPERLRPLLAGLLELLPWVKQWHPEPGPDTGEPFGDFLEQWLEAEAREHGFSFDDLRAWRPSSARAKKTPAKKQTASKKSTSKKKTSRKAEKDAS